MPADADETYEHWRRLWLSGGDSHAIAALRFHGLRGALTVTSSVHADHRPPPPSVSPPVAELVIGGAVLVEAASQNRRLLRPLPAHIISPTGVRTESHV